MHFVVDSALLFFLRHKLNLFNFMHDETTSKITMKNKMIA